MKNRLGVKLAAVAVISSMGLAVVAAPAGAVTYKVNPAMSTFKITASTSGVSAHDRHLATKSFTGSVALSNTMQPQSVQMTVKANSFKSIDQNESATDRTRINNATAGPILEASKYPNIVFKSTKIVPNKPIKGAYRVQVFGKLTLHGVTRPVVIPVSGAISGNTLRGSGSLRIKQSDYNITLLSLLGGIIRVNDPLTLSFNIVATK